MSPLQQGQGDGIANTVTSQKNSVRLDGLKANARYMVQVRARTVAGYGRYSLPTEFQTTAEDGRCQHGTASIPQPSYTCLFSSLTSHSCFSLHQAPPARLSRSCLSSWVRPLQDCCLSSWWSSSLSSASGSGFRGVVACSEVGVACGQSSSSSSLRAEGWTCCPGVLLPDEELWLWLPVVGFGIWQ